ncbi:MAG: nuclear transport factor 2 family protein [Bacteroidota bacterium]
MTPRLALPLVALALVLAGFSYASRTSDLDAVMAPLNLYLEGHATGNGDLMRQAFHPDARLFWIDDGELAQRPSPEFAGLFRGTPASDEADRRRRVVSVDITGDVAVAKIELDYPRVFITDYMTLIRLGDEWKITHKAFTREPARSR